MAHTFLRIEDTNKSNSNIKTEMNICIYMNHYIFFIIIKKIFPILLNLQPQFFSIDLRKKSTYKGRVVDPHLQTPQEQPGTPLWIFVATLMYCPKSNTRTLRQITILEIGKIGTEQWYCYNHSLKTLI